jgi:heme/copper-type cytochrome/quinol oxidase subunit 2
MTKVASQMRWTHYILFLFLGLVLFLISAITTFSYLWDLRSEQPKRNAYEHHVMMLAQISLERLTYRLILAGFSQETLKENEYRPSLEQQLEITWSRFNDLVQGKNAGHLRLIPGLQVFVGKISSALENLEIDIQTQNIDYARSSKYFSQLKKEFYRSSTNLPVRLLPIYAEQLSHLHAQHDWYYLALLMSCLVVLFIYVLSLWRLLQMLKQLS